MSVEEVIAIHSLPTVNPPTSRLSFRFARSRGDVIPLVGYCAMSLDTEIDT